jgi:hypothetical protein
MLIRMRSRRMVLTLFDPPPGGRRDSRLDLIAGAVADIEDDDRVIADREDDPILVRSLAVEHFPNLFRELVVLGRERAAQRMARQNLDLFEQALIPALRLLRRVLGDPGVVSSASALARSVISK